MNARDPHQHTSMYERNLDDSEDSDGEGGLGNLNRLVIRPLGHSGKAKKGHLCFDASFESGNLGRVDLISDFEYDLFVRPDTCCPKIRLWFNFMVDNVKQDQRVIFNIVNFGKSRNLYNSDMTPIVKSTSKPKWQRLVRRNVFYHRSIYHRFRHILSFAFAFDKEEDVYHFAMATPYSYSKLQAYLETWMKKGKHLSNAIDRQVIGQSIQKRQIDLITIGDEQNNDDDGEVKTKPEKRRVVVIIARTHGGEPPSSYVCQGLMDFLISSHFTAQLIRKKITLKIIPMLNPDGVYLGNQRTSLFGFDLNRSWHMISQWAHPTLKAAYDTIKNIEAKRERYQLDFIIDIHAHSSMKGCFIYGNSYDDVYRYERHIVFPKTFAAKTEGYCAENSFYNADSSKMGTARRFFCTSLGKNTNTFTLQVSMGGYNVTGLPYYIHHNEDSSMTIFTCDPRSSDNIRTMSYILNLIFKFFSVLAKVDLRLGRNLGKSLYEYYKQINIITAPAKKSEGRSTRKSRRLKSVKIRHAYQKPSPSPPGQLCLEPRIISPSIIRPDPNNDAYPTGSKLPVTIYEYPAIQSKVIPKKSVTHKSNVDEAAANKLHAFNRMSTSPLPSLTIIDLNNTIRSGLRENHGKTQHKNKLGKIERRSAKKRHLLKQWSYKNSKPGMSSSDDDFIDI